MDSRARTIDRTVSDGENVKYMPSMFSPPFLATLGTCDKKFGKHSDANAGDVERHPWLPNDDELGAKDGGVHVPHGTGIYDNGSETMRSSNNDPVSGPASNLGRAIPIAPHPTGGGTEESHDCGNAPVSSSGEVRAPLLGVDRDHGKLGFGDGRFDRGGASVHMGDMPFHVGAVVSRGGAVVPSAQGPPSSEKQLGERLGALSETLDYLASFDFDSLITDVRRRLEASRGHASVLWNGGRETPVDQQQRKRPPHDAPFPPHREEGESGSFHPPADKRPRLDSGRHNCRDGAALRGSDGGGFGGHPGMPPPVRELSSAPPKRRTLLPLPSTRPALHVQVRDGMVGADGAYAANRRSDTPKCSAFGPSSCYSGAQPQATRLPCWKDAPSTGSRVLGPELSKRGCRNEFSRKERKDIDDSVFAAIRNRREQIYRDAESQREFSAGYIRNLLTYAWTDPVRNYENVNRTYVSNPVDDPSELRNIFDDDPTGDEEVQGEAAGEDKVEPVVDDEVKDKPTEDKQAENDPAGDKKVEVTLGRLSCAHPLNHPRNKRYDRLPVVYHDWIHQSRLAELHGEIHRLEKREKEAKTEEEAENLRREIKATKRTLEGRSMHLKAVSGEAYKISAFYETEFPVSGFWLGVDQFLNLQRIQILAHSYDSLYGLPKIKDLNIVRRENS